MKKDVPYNPSLDGIAGLIQGILRVPEPEEVVVDSADPFKNQKQQAEKLAKIQIAQSTKQRKSMPCNKAE